MPVYSCTLWQYFKQQAIGQVAIPMVTRYEMFENLLDGLMYIQQKKLRHLDMKLSNVLIRIGHDGKWDGSSIVITDFGIGGKSDGNQECAGTPGFASPEQLIGAAHAKSDNYGFGRLMAFIFCSWKGAWNLLFKPVTELDINALSPDTTRDQLFKIIKDLTQVNI